MKSEEQSASGKGVFISFEGPECAGKTTQIRMLNEYFAKRNIDTIVTREPGGTVIGEELRKIVKHHVGETAVVDEAEVLLFAASRAQHVHKVIIPALNSGINVICDRYVDSTTAYQGYGRGLDLSFIETLNRFATAGCMPDLTFVLDLTAEESSERIINREETLFIEDRIESAELAFHKKVRQGFLEIARREPQRVKIISAIQPKELIQRQIIGMLENVIG